MGFYINPPRGKKQFLDEQGVLVHLDYPWGQLPYDCLPVMWVSNIVFDAAAIAYDENELEQFRCDAKDRRPKLLYIVEVKDILTVCGKDFERWYAARS